MALTIGKRDIARMVEVLDQDHADIETAARAALDAAMTIFQAKARYTVAGQLWWRTGPIDPDEARANQVALGWYSTQTQAHKDAHALVYSAQTHETFRTWVLPIHHGSPNEYYKARKQARDAAEVALKSSQERELQSRIQWFRENPSAPAPEDWGFVWNTAA